MRLRRGFGGGGDEGCDLLILFLLSVGASLLAKAACQPTMLYLNAPNRIVGASPAGDGVLPADHFEAECTDSNTKPVGAAEGCDLLIFNARQQRQDQKDRSLRQLLHGTLQRAEDFLRQTRRRSGRVLADGFFLFADHFEQAIQRLFGHVVFDIRAFRINNAKRSGLTSK